MPPQTAAPKPALTQSAPQSFVPSRKSRLPLKGLFVFLLIILSGVASGYFMATTTSAGSPDVAPGGTKSAGEVGVSDDTTFRDCAKGTVEANDLTDTKSEGSHKLIRDGGPSQTVYMTSSVLALDDYVGKKVEVCGETNDSKKVSWFMDVGRLKLLQ